MYHNRVTLSLIPVQRLGNQASNCKMEHMIVDQPYLILIDIVMINLVSVSELKKVMMDASNQKQQSQAIIKQPGAT